MIHRDNLYNSIYTQSHTSVKPFYSNITDVPIPESEDFNGTLADYFIIHNGEEVIYVEGNGGFWMDRMRLHRGSNVYARPCDVLKRSFF